MKQILRDAFIIVILAVFIAFMNYIFSNSKLPLVKPDKSAFLANDSLLFNYVKTQVIDTNTNQQFVTITTDTVKKPIIDSVKVKQKTDSIKKAKSMNPLIEQSSSKLLTVNLDQMKKIVNLPDFIIIDARRPDQYSAGHIKNSINIFAQDEQDILIPKILQLPRDKKIIVYCDGGTCDLSHELANNLINAFSFKNVYVYEGGWDEWKKNN